MERLVTKRIESLLSTGKIILLIGQRQVGKTFELNRLLGEEFYQKVKLNLA